MVISAYLHGWTQLKETQLLHFLVYGTWCFKPSVKREVRFKEFLEAKTLVEFHGTSIYCMRTICTLFGSISKYGHRHLKKNKK